MSIPPLSSQRSPLIPTQPSLASLRKHVHIDEVNCEFYNSSEESFDVIPFQAKLPDLLLKYGTGQKYLEIGSGPGALALWLTEKGHEVTCIEPAEKLAGEAAKKGLTVHPLTIQEFTTVDQYDCLVAISSLIHVPKPELPDQIKKIASLLKPQGIFFVSFLEGDDEVFEDPTKVGKVRFFAKWNESDLNRLLSPYFDVIETHKVTSSRMGCTFFLSVYALNGQFSAISALHA